MAPVSLLARAALAPAPALGAAELLAAFHAYNSLLLVGFFGLLVVLLTALFSPAVQRNAAWISFYISCLCYTLSYLLLFFAGEGFTFMPSTPLCLVQAAMTYATPPLATSAAFILSLTMWMGICRPYQYKAMMRLNRWGLYAPWVLAFAIFLIALAVGQSDLAGVHIAHEFYCQIDNRIPSRISEVAVVLTFAANVVFQALTFRGLWLVRAKDDDDAVGRGPALSVSVRMLLWNISTISTVVLIYIFINNDAGNTRTVSLVQAFLPIMALLAFGTRMDILGAWAAVFRGDRHEKNVY